MTEELSPGIKYIVDEVGKANPTGQLDEAATKHLVELAYRLELSAITAQYMPFILLLLLLGCILLSLKLPRLGLLSFLGCFTFLFLIPEPLYQVAAIIGALICFGGLFFHTYRKTA